MMSIWAALMSHRRHNFGIVKCPRLLYQSQCKFSVDDSAGMRSGAGDGVWVSCSSSLVLAFFMPASPLVFVQTLPAARSPANCVDAADCNLAAKLRSFVLHHSDWPELIPAESSTEKLHWDWYRKRGHFTMTSCAVPPL